MAPMLKARFVIKISDFTTIADYLDNGVFEAFHMI